jgi:hypothetical protein
MRSICTGEFRVGILINLMPRVRTGTYWCGAQCVGKFGRARFGQDHTQSLLVYKYKVGLRLMESPVKRMPIIFVDRLASNRSRYLVAHDGECMKETVFHGVRAAASYARVHQSAARRSSQACTIQESRIPSFTLQVKHIRVRR